MNRIIGSIIAASLFALILMSAAFPQGAVTLVQIMLGGSAVSSTNPLPVSSSGAGLGFTPLTPMQSGVAITSSTALTVPSGSTYAVVCSEGQSVKYSTDGTTVPTSTVGMLLLQNQCVSLSGATVISNFRAIQVTATATLDASYFK